MPNQPALFLLCGLLLIVGSALVQAQPKAFTLDGFVLGQFTQISQEFLGIPYAADASGNNRWKPPQPVEPWFPNTFVATAYADTCWTRDPLTTEPNQGENCLALNVYAPRNSKPGDNRPVYLYAHGGAFVNGATSSQQFNGSSWANATGEIIVTYDYRLGALGLLGLPGAIEETNSFGNYALMDQVALFKWAKTNIFFFGGNPFDITIGGQSAGAISAGIHLTTVARTAGLFEHVIMESGAPSVLQPAQLYTNLTEQLAANFGCSGTDAQILACLRQVNATEIIAWQVTIPYFVKPRPCLDGFWITEQPLTQIAKGCFLTDVSVLSGFHTNESAVLDAKAFFPTFIEPQATFVANMIKNYGAPAEPEIITLYNGTNGLLPSIFAANAKADTDHDYFCQVRLFSRTMAASGFNNNIFMYHMNRNPPFAPVQLGAYHTSEQAYNFGHPCFNEDFPFGPVCGPTTGPPPEWTPGTPDAQLSSIIRQLWFNFSTTGVPSPTWPRLSEPNFPNLFIDADANGPIFSIEHELTSNCDFWDSLLPPYCGNGVCDSGETRQNCQPDCCPTCSTIGNCAFSIF